MNKLQILYTTKEGGEYRWTQAETDSQTAYLFEELKEKGEISLKTGDADPVPEKLAYIRLLDELDDWDFIIKSRRD